MPTANELATAALSKSSTTLRNALVKRVIYPIDTAEDAEDFTANNAGTVPLAIALLETRSIFWLQADDALSEHDGVSVIVTSDGYRYHATDFRWPTFLLAVDEETPPVSPNAGDAYQIGVAPTGDWSSNAGDIAIFTSRGWVFLTPSKGLLFYNEDDGQHYYQDENGDFVAISVIPGPNTVFHDAIVGGKTRYIVENQTTNTPPTPTVGVFHIVGPSPTGDWTGQAGKIATSKDGSTFVFITPFEGIQAYDKAVNANYIYNGGWISGAGAWSTVVSSLTGSSSSTASRGSVASDGYAFHPSTAPTTSQAALRDQVTLSHAAASTGTGKLRLTYNATAAVTTSSTPRAGVHGGVLTLAIFRDSETSAIAWTSVASIGEASVTINVPVHAVFLVDVGDTSSHTYEAVLMKGGDAQSVERIDVPALYRRTFIIEEKF